MKNKEALEQIKAQAWIDFAKTNKDVEMYSFVVGFDRGHELAQEQICNHSYILTDDNGYRIIKCLKCNNIQPI